MPFLDLQADLAHQVGFAAASISGHKIDLTLACQGTIKILVQLSEFSLPGDEGGVCHCSFSDVVIL